MSDTSREAAEAAIDVLLQERREFPPPAEFVSQAVVSDPGVYEQAEADLDGFWLEKARSTGTRSRPRASNGTRRTAPGLRTAP